LKKTKIKIEGFDMKKAVTQLSNDSFSLRNENCSKNSTQYTQHHQTSTSNVNAANDFGLMVDHIDQDEQLHRVPTHSKPSKKNGWYVAYNDCLVMGNWQTGEVETFKPSGQKITREDKQRIAQSRERNKLVKRQQQEQAAVLARAQYAQATDAVTHQYLVKKGISDIKGLKVANNQLLVPLFDLNTGMIKNIQRIYPDGAKRFLKNGQINGLCCPCGLLNMQSEWPEQLTKVFICEGYATAASVYQMTNQPALAAMNSGNLLAVGKAAKEKWPDVEIVFAGDDDYLTEQKRGINPGKSKANEAAHELDAQVSFPPFTLEHKLAGLSDWNDYWLDSNRSAAQ
jgi:putative DNA primase/helicase